VHKDREGPSYGSPPGGVWDTDSGNSGWIVGAALAPDDALLNEPGNGSVNFPLNQGGSFVIAISDVAGLLFNPGETITATVRFHDGNSAVDNLVIPDDSDDPMIELQFIGTTADRVGQGHAAPNG